MDKQTAIHEYLKRHHVGKDNAIYSRDLQSLFCIDGRNLRRKVNALRKDGVPICSGDTGYYYAQHQQEINETVCRMNSLLTTISNARTGLLFASILAPTASKVELTIKIE